MKKILKISFVGLLLVTFGCKEEPKFAPAIPFDIKLNQKQYQNGDSLFGEVIVDMNKVESGTEIEKIDCRLANIVIGNAADSPVCKFGVRLKDKPLGTHTLSVIIKYQVPDFDVSYIRADLKVVDIVDAKNE